MLEVIRTPKHGMVSRDSPIVIDLSMHVCLCTSHSSVPKDVAAWACGCPALSKMLIGAVQLARYIASAGVFSLTRSLVLSLVPILSTDHFYAPSVEHEHHLDFKCGHPIYILLLA